MVISTASWQDALTDASALRRAPAGGGEITLDTKLTVLVDRHIERLIEDDRAAATIETYRATATKLARSSADCEWGVDTGSHRCGARSMRTGHGAGMARHVRVLLRGGLQLAVMATVLGSNPVRAVSQMKSKAKPKGAQAFKADEVRDSLGKPRVSEFCRHHDLSTPSPC